MGHRRTKYLADLTRGRAARTAVPASGTSDLVVGVSGNGTRVLPVSGTASLVLAASGDPDRIPRASGTANLVVEARGDVDRVLRASGTSALVLQAQGNITRILVPMADVVGALLEVVLDCADLAIEPSAGRAALYPGAEVAWDDCCDGQVYARLISMTPTGSPATAARVVSPCGVLVWAATIGVGVIRCAATVDDQGNPPTPAALTENTLQMTADMMAVAEAVNCCVAPQVSKLQMLRWDPLGPEGGCTGGEWSFTVLVDNCKCL